ncbi:MAG TPA: helicase-related protein [Plantibacter sp.]|uniref:helicase-related protein n=1 Tax=Plantibacter sp. TaxID=1871045 RepID=UPI002CA55441|nr:helicase-related protein [Plantibacter sp.]
MTETTIERSPETAHREPYDQERIAVHLSDRVRSLLAGDAPERKRIVRRRPSKVLQLGILPPQPPVDDDEIVEALARRGGGSGGAPSTMGLDFLVAPDAAGKAVVEIEAEFSIYVQRYPTYDEQKEWWSKDTSLEGDESEEDAKPGSGKMRLLSTFERFDIKAGPVPIEIDANQSPEKIERDLSDAIGVALGTALVDLETVYPFKQTQTLPEDALESKHGWEEAIREAESDARRRPLAPPTAQITVSWRRAGENLRVHATLANTAVAKARPKKREKQTGPRELHRDLHLFNCRLRVSEKSGTFQRTQFNQAPEDFRYAESRYVWATGHNCVGERDVETGALFTNTWPLYRQRRLVPRDKDGLEIRFADLANESTYRKALLGILDEMRQFEGDWKAALKTWPDESTKPECERSLADFQNDIRGFERGLQCLADDKQLRRAYLEANEVFRRQGATRRYPIEKWRLFQVVYQVIHLAALRARESDEAELLAELDIVDVLWFPTGGGKTEAYLGLITTLLFYDRLRGKERGVGAILRFPLRMLSVQQLQRVLAVLWFAERRRREIVEAEGLMHGDELGLGYWIGGSGENTPSPNYISREKSWGEGSIEWWAEFIANEPEEARKRRVITRCPNPDCNGGDVELQADVTLVRLQHVCRNCKEVLPVFVSDEEVYRYLPSVLVCTVDKLAQIARAEEFTNVVAGPAFRCPKHGYFTWHQSVWDSKLKKWTADDRCGAGRYCEVPATDYELVEHTHDPAPALQVQDELHLLEEELGTFNAHYETLVEELQRSFGTKKPAKLLAATATIEAYDAQVQHLYARNARVFPSPGWELGESFYTTTTEDARRLYVGALPFRPDPSEFGEKVQEMLHLEVMRLQDDIELALEELEMPHRGGDWLVQQLFLYELTLGYVNRKQDGDRISNLLQTLAQREVGVDPLEVTVLIGDSSLSEIADSLELIETETLDNTERADRLRAVVATSVVSHGVDIDRLNLMIVNGMTTSTASYIQASSRAGRSHVGLVVVSYDRRKARDLSFYRHFLKYHEFIDRLIAPVPVNRFAKFAAKRTVPGVLSTLLIQVYGRQRLEEAGPNPRKPIVGSLSKSRHLQKWWAAEERKDELTERALRALGIDRRLLVCVEGEYREQLIFDPMMVASFRYDAIEEIDAQLDFMRDFQRDYSTSGLFQPAPMISFRSVDEPMDFTVSHAAKTIEADLTSGFRNRKDATQ